MALVDVVTGLHAAVAILAALRARDATGPGEHVEVSLLDSAFSALVNVAQNALLTAEEPGRYGNAHPSIAPYQPFRTADGWVAVAAANDGLFARLCDVVGLPELAADERFQTNAARVRNRAELLEPLEAAFARRTAADWVAELDAAGVPAGKIRGVLEALGGRSPQRSASNIRPPGRSSSSRRPSHSSRPGFESPLPRRCSASTHARCWASWASTMPGSPSSRRRASWPRPDPRIASMATLERESVDLREPGLLLDAGFVGGSWVDADAGRTFEVLEPGDRRPHRRGAADGCRRDAARDRGGRRRLPGVALAARAASARGSCAGGPTCLVAHADDLALLLTSEQGKPLVEAKAEVVYAASFLEWFGEEAKRIYGDTIPTHMQDRRVVVTQGPVGVSAGITPWNFPAAMPTRKAAPALAAGNTMVLKPAEQTPLIGARGR